MENFHSLYCHSYEELVKGIKEFYASKKAVLIYCHIDLVKRDCIYQINESNIFYINANPIFQHRFILSFLNSVRLSNNDFPKNHQNRRFFGQMEQEIKEFSLKELKDYSDRSIQNLQAKQKEIPQYLYLE